MIIKYERSQTALALGGISPEPRKSGLEYIALETTRSYTRRRGVFFSLAELQMLVDDAAMAGIMNDKTTIRVDEDGARVDGATLGDHEIPPIRVDQSIMALAKIVALTIGSFSAGIVEPIEKRAMTSFCLALFTYELIGHASDERQAAMMLMSAADEKLAALDKQPEETPPDDAA